MAGLLGDELKDVGAEIKKLVSKQEKVEEALEGRGAYLGTTDHDELMEHLQSLRKERGQLREKELVLLRQRGPLGTLQRGPASGESTSSNGSSGSYSPSCYSSDSKCSVNEDEGEKHPGSEDGLPSTLRTRHAENGQQQQQQRPKRRKREVRIGSDAPADASPDSCAAESSTAGSGQQKAVSAADGEAKKTITIRVRNQTGEETLFKVKTSTSMEKVFNTYASRKGVSVQALGFLLDGRRVNYDDTPASLELDDGDQIDCILYQLGGKPVILLYPEAPVDVTVALQLSPLWSFSALYPKPAPHKLAQPSDSEAMVNGGQQCEWSIHASPDGSLEDKSTGREYPYLFWEADSDGRVSRSFGLDYTQSFCVAGGAAGVFLDDALERLGLNMRERCDMVTYWLPQLEASPFNVIYFVETARYEQAARLTIVPAPDVTIRVFMAFRGVKSYDAELDTARVEGLQAPTREGFVAVEWGGMNLDGKMQH